MAASALVHGCRNMFWKMFTYYVCIIKFLVRCLKGFVWNPYLSCGSRDIMYIRKWNDAVFTVLCKRQRSSSGMETLCLINIGLNVFEGGD